MLIYLKDRTKLNFIKKSKKISSGNREVGGIASMGTRKKKQKAIRSCDT